MRHVWAAIPSCASHEFRRQSLRHIARQVAALHLNAKRSPLADRAASAQATLARWGANYAELAPLAHLLADPSLEPGRRTGRRYLAGRDHLFAQRVRPGG